MGTKDYPEVFTKNFNKGFATLSDKSSEKDVQLLYDDWAPQYDKTVSDARFVGYEPVVDAFDALPGMQSNKNIKIMDAAAGTGSIGEKLKRRGYTNLHALDISQGMLDEAKKKNVYQKLICAPLTKEKTPGIGDEEYDALIMTGALSAGHVRADAFDELLRIVKRGGVVCFNIRCDQVEYHERKIKELEAQGKWQLLNKASFPFFASEELPSEAVFFAFKVI